ncbi:MAG: hypothetical protein IPK55_13755 [Streptococcus sp.]|nr:hypothetical protein [Streptococcus sp.]
METDVIFTKIPAMMGIGTIAMDAIGNAIKNQAGPALEETGTIKQYVVKFVEMVSI